MECVIEEDTDTPIKKVKFIFTRAEQASFLFFMTLAIAFIIIITQYFGLYLVTVLLPNANNLTIILLMSLIMVITIIIFVISFYYRIKDIFTPVTLRVNTEKQQLEVISPFKSDYISFMYSQKTILIHDYKETRELVFQDPSLLQGTGDELKNGMYRIPRSTYLSIRDKYKVFVFFKTHTPITILEFEDLNQVVEEFKLDDPNVTLTPQLINELLHESSKGKPFTLENEK